MKQLYTIGAVVVFLIALLFILSRMSGGEPDLADLQEEANDAAEQIDETTETEEGATLLEPNEVNEKIMEEAMSGETTRATMKTNMGDIVLELYTDQSPITAGNFVKLAKEDFYDGVKFHRVIDGFMIQAGDPQSKDDSLQARWGTGGPGYAIEDEFIDGLSNVKGTISMANSGPNSGGSQWFINLVDNTNLDFDKQPLASKHPVFGKVVEGMDVVEAIGKVETVPGDRPVEPVVIEDIIVE